MGIPSHWTGSSHVTQASIKVNGGPVSGRFHYPSNANEHYYLVQGTVSNQWSTYARGAMLRTDGQPMPQTMPRPTAHPQTMTRYDPAASVLWNLKLMGWSRYLQWLQSDSPPRGSFWGRRDNTGNYPAKISAQNSYELKSNAEPSYVPDGFGNFRRYTFAIDGTVKDYFLWAFLGGGTSQNIVGACPDFASSVYFQYFTTEETYKEKQSQLESWPTKHLSLSWTSDS
jgi:hypothetical protein